MNNEKFSRQLFLDSNPKLSTPILALYTHSGSIPCLSWNFIRKSGAVLYKDHVEQSGDDEAADLVKLNLSDFVNNLENGEYCCESFELQSKYFNNCLFMLTLFDPLKCYQDYKSTDDFIPMSSLHGKRTISVSQISNLAKNIDVQFCQSLAVINTPPNVGRKWTAKAVQRSIKFLDDTIVHKEMIGEPDISLKRKHKTEFCQPKIWATVTGGYSSVDRIVSAKNVSEVNCKLNGVIIDGFYGYQTDAPIEPFSYKKCQTLLNESVLNNLPTKLPRALWGAFLPHEMLQMIHDGIDILDSSICTLLSERGEALPSPLIDTKEILLRFHLQPINIDNSSPSCIINLSEDCYANINMPISSDCKCYTCDIGAYSRAYINHMLKRKEMNGTMLLQIHNHFVLTQFFANIRTLIVTGQFDTLLVNSAL